VKLMMSQLRLAYGFSRKSISKIKGRTNLNQDHFTEKAKMNSHHLTTGEPNPPLVPGSLRIYSMRYCPYAQRALLAAAAKGIKYDVVNVNLTNKPEFIFEKNPDGKVPTVETNNGLVLYESLIVADYIDEAYKASPSGGDASANLTPQDPYQKALDRLWIQKFEKVASLDFQLYFKTGLSSAEIDTIVEQLHQELAIFENELKRRGTKFFAGSAKPGMLDLMIWPWMERIPCLELILEEKKSAFQKGRASLPTLTQWQKDMTEDEAIKPSYCSAEIHAEYRKMKRSGAKLNYDFRNN